MCVAHTPYVMYILPRSTAVPSSTTERAICLRGSAHTGGSSSRTCSEFREAPGGGVGAMRCARSRQCVGQGGPVGALQETSRQQRDAARCSDLGIRGVFFAQQREQALPDSIVRASWQRGRAGGCA